MLCLAGHTLSQSPPPIELNEDDSIIVELKLKRYTLSDALMAYHSLDHTLVSLQEFVEAIDYPITVDSEEGWASGWFVNESNTFELNIAKGELYVRGERIDLSKNFIHASDDYGLYVDIKHLREWFGLSIVLLMDRLQLIIESDVIQPIEQKIEREKKRAAKPKTARKGELYPIVKDQYHLFGQPGFDLQMSASTTQEEDTYGYSLQGVSDILWHETRISHAQASLDSDPSSRLMFSRRSVEEGKAMLLGVSAYSGGDIYGQGDNLVARSSSGVGFQLERNLSGSVDDSFSRRDFEGDAPPGWEVELYRNDLLIAFQTADESGRYIFTDVDLQFGENLFEIRIFGPQGQKRVETRRISIGSQLITPGEWQFYGSYIERGEQLIGEPVFASTAAEPLADISSTVYYGLATQHTFGLGFNRSAPSERALERNYGRMTWLGAFSWFTSRLDYAQDMDFGGSAWALDLSGRLLDQSISISGRKFDEFVSAQNNSGNIIEEIDANIFSSLTLWNWRPIPYAFGFGRTSSLSGLERYRAENRVGFSIHKVRIANQLNYSSDNQDGPVSGTGIFSVTLPSWRGQTRASLSYDAVLREATSFSLSNTINSVDWRFQFQANSFLVEGQELNSLVANVSRTFGNVSMSFSVQADDQKNYAAGLILEMGLYTKGEAPFFAASKTGQVSAGAVNAIVFMDNDANQIFSEGDEPLPDVKFKGRVAWNDLATGKDGSVFLQGIDTSQGSVVHLDTMTLSDPYLQTARPSVKVKSHAGGKQKVYFPINQTSEVEGNVLVNRGGRVKGAGGIPVGLFLNGELIKQVRTEFDGYFLITGVIPGTYTVNVVDDEGVMGSYKWEASEEFFADAENGLHSLDDIVLDYQPE